MVAQKSKTCRFKKVWATAIAVTTTYLVYRYHFWGKWASQKHDSMSEQELQEWAARNKRYFYKTMGICSLLQTQIREIYETPII